MGNICLTNYTSPLLYESAYKDYLFSKMNEEAKLQHMISKQLIMTESTTLKVKEQKLSVLYEEKIGDSIKSKWNKFVDFINSLFGKFMESITNLLFSYKKYLEKYKDIILNKKFKIKLTDPIPNYTTGINRCLNTKVPIFQYNDVNMNALKSDNDYDAIKLIIKDSQFTPDEGKELAENLKDYFLGADGTIDDLDKLKRADMYNFCYNADKIEKLGKADLSALKSTTNVIERAITNEMQKTNEAFILEADEDNNTTATVTGQSGSNNNTDNKNNNTPKPGVKLDTNPVKSSLSNDYKNNPDENLQQQAQDAKNNGETDETVSDAFDKWRKVCQAVITAKMTAQESIAKDYMNIIRAHVRSYVGKKSDETDNETQKATNYANNNNKNNNSNANSNNNQNK